MLELVRKIDADTTVHGFRSSFRDWAGNQTNYPREIAEAALAHRVGDATEAAYRRSDALEKRRKLMRPNQPLGLNSPIGALCAIPSS